MRKPKYLSLWLVFILLSCSPGSKYRVFHEFDQEVWNRFENPVLEFNITDPGIYYDMFLKLNYKPSQKLENFKVTVIMTTPSGEVRSRDIDLDFSKGVGAGKQSELSVVLRREYAFSDQGKCYFEIENRSSEVNTVGIKSVGVYLEKSQ